MNESTPQKRVLLPSCLRRVLLGVFSAFAVSLFIAVISVAQPAEAATSSTINFQARLQSASGSIVPDGFYNVQFKLYDDPTAGTNLWTESYYDTNGATTGNDYRVRVQNGYLSVALGSQTAFPSINWDQQLYLTMNIGGTTVTATPTYDGEMNPRLALSAVPYAFKAGQLAKQTGANTSTLGFDTQTASRNILLPDESGTLCIRNSSACGFLTGAGANGSYVQLQTTTPGTQQTGNLNISGNGIYGGGIGVGTSTLGAQIHVNAAATTSTTLGQKDARLMLQNNTSTVGAGGEIVFAYLDAANSRYAAIGSGASSNTGVNGGTGYLYLATKALNTDTTLTERLRVNAGGNIGIGTTNNTYKLEVAGDVNLTTGSAYRINGTSICTSTGCTASSGSGSYIQNGTAQQASSNFNISGNGTIGGNATVAGNVNVANVNSVQTSYNASTVVTSNVASVSQSPLAGGLWHDLFAFNRKVAPTFEQFDGTTWNAATMNPALFAHLENQTISVLNGTTTTAARWTWNSTSFSYSAGKWLNIGFSYNGATSANKTVLFETSADGVTWTTRHTSTGNTQNAVPAWFYTVDNGSHQYLRLSITSTNAQPVMLNSIRLLSDRWGDQGGGSELSYPYQWNAYQQMAIGANAIASNGNLTIGTNTTAAAGGLYFGTDTNLYRSGAHTLTTDDALTVAGVATLQNGASVTGGINNNNGGITNAGSITGASLLTTTGNITSMSGILSIQGSGNNYIAGNLGIGTNTPGYKLDVNGDVNVAAGSSFKIGGVNICTSSGCVASGGGNGYIQNGTSQQSLANFNIDGNGSVGGSLKSGGKSLSVTDAGTAAEAPTTNLLYGAGTSNGAFSNLSPASITMTTLPNGRLRLTSTAGGSVRVFANNANLVNGANYANSLGFENNTGNVGLDWVDMSVPGASSSAAAGRISGYASKSTYDATYRFMDVNLTGAMTVDIFDPQVELGTVATSFVPGVRGVGDIVSRGVMQVLGVGTSNYTGSLNVTGAATFGGGLNVTGGLNNNNGGFTNVGAVSGVTTLAASGNISSTAGVLNIQGTGTNYFAGTIGLGTGSTAARFQVRYDTTNVTSEGDYSIRVDEASQVISLLLGVSATNGASLIQSFDPGTSWTTRTLALQPNGGNVSVGTLTSSYKLDVNGTFRATGNALIGNGTTGSLQVGDGIVTKTSGSGFIFNSGLNAQAGLYTGATNGTQRLDATGNLLNIGTYNGSGNIATTGGTVSAQGSGNNSFAGAVGLGTTSPTEKLDVNGNSRVNGVTYNENMVDNMFVDGGFEYSSNQLNTPSGGAIVANATLAYTGNNVLRITGNSSTQDATRRDPMQVTPGQQYYFEGWRKTDGTFNGETYGMLFTFLDKDSVTPSYSAFSTLTGVQATWTKFSGVVTVPAGKMYMTFGPSVRNTATTGNIYYDDLYMTRIDTPGGINVAGSAVLQGGANITGGANFNTSAITGVSTITASGNISSTAGVISMQGSGSNSLAGSLGIGTTAPNYKLEVQGETFATGGFRVSSVNGDNINGAPWYGMGLSTLSIAGSGSSVQVAGYFGLGLKTASGQAVLTQAGNFGIGNTAPAHKLDVNGDVNIAAGSAYKINGTDICTSAGCTMAAGSGSYIQNGTTQQAGANFNISGNGVAAGTLTGSSLVSTVASGTAPLQVASNTLVSNLNSQYLNGMSENLIAQNLRSGYNLTGGGTVTYTGSGITWTERLIVIANGNGADFSTSGYYDIYVPANGTVITGVGGATSVTVSGGTIPLDNWTALYYIMPNGSSAGSLATNFRVMTFGGASQVPSNWLLIALRNADNGAVRTGLGITLRSGQSTTAGAINNAVFNTSVTTPILQSASGLTINAAGSNLVQIGNNGSTRLIVDSAGDVRVMQSLAVGGVSNQQVTIGAGANNHGLEIGRTDSTSSTPFLDFHSGATAVDFDSRIIASGGNGSNGGGTLSFTAGNTNISGNLQTGGATRLDNLGNLSNINAYSGAGNITTTGGVLTVQGAGNNFFSGNVGIGMGAVQKLSVAGGPIGIYYGQQESVIGYGFSQENDSNVWYHKLGTTSTNNGQIRVEGTMGGHAISQGKANIDVLINTRDGFKANAIVNGLVSNTADLEVYLETNGTHSVYAVTRDYARINLRTTDVGSSTLVASPSASLTVPTGTKAFTLSTDARLTYDLDGDLGIGTVNPLARLQVAGGNILLDNNTNLQFKNASGTATDILGVGSDNTLRLRAAASGATVHINADNTGSTYLNFNNTGPVQVGNGTAATNFYVANGNVGIGNSSTTYKLDVSGTTRLNGNVTLGTGNSLTLGSGAISGVTTLGASGNISGQTLTSTVATGTAPLTVSSTTKVTNLNADLLDGLDSSAFAAATGSTSYIQNGTSTQASSNFNISGNGIIGGTLSVGASGSGSKIETNGSIATLFGGTSANYANVATYNYSGTITGTMKFTMPKGWANSMVRMVIRGYDYSGSGAWEVVVGGFSYDTTLGWLNTSAQINGAAPFTQVRLAYDGTKTVVLLGNTTSSWAYPQVQVSEFQSTFGNVSGWGSGWSSSMLTTETGLTNIATPYIASYMNIAGNYGIGTTSPTARLTVGGGITASGTIAGSTINATSAFQLNGATGATTTCSGGHFLQNAVVVGGIITGGNCAAGGGGGGSGVTTVGTINSQTKSANGAVIVGTTLYMQTADANNSGLVSTTAQAFSGYKTFEGGIDAQNDTTLIINDDSTYAIRVVQGAAGVLGIGGNDDGVTMQTFVNKHLILNPIGNNVGIGTSAPTAKLDLVGTARFKSATNSTSAFQVLNSSDVPSFQVDTSNSIVYIGQSGGTSSGALLVLGNKTSSGDPTGQNGAMYYNSNSNKFRCYENSVWRNCLNIAQVDRYASAGGQAIPAFADTKIVFGTKTLNDGNVSVNGANDTFTLNKAGLWQISASARTTGTQSLYLGLAEASNFGNRLVQTDNYSNANVSTTYRFNSGFTVAALAFCNTVCTTDAGLGSNSVNITFTWLGE